MTKTEFKTLEEIQEVQKLKKPEKVQKLFWKMYKDGVHYNEAEQKVKEQYNEEYGDILENENTLICDTEETVTITNEESEGTSEEIEETTLIPNRELAEDEKIEDFVLVPSEKLFIQKAEYEPLEWSDDLNKEYFDFMMPNLIADINIKRDELTENITVELKTGEILQGDEKSQERMARTLAVIGTGKINWIGANNDIYELDKTKLKEALLKAGQEQANIFITHATEKAAIQG